MLFVVFMFMLLAEVVANNQCSACCEMKKRGFSVYWVISSFACFSGWTMISMKVTDDCGCILQERQGGIQGAAEAATGRQQGLPPHQPPPLSTASMQYSSSANRQDSPQRCISLFFSSQSDPQPHRLVSARSDRSVSVKLCSPQTCGAR